MAEKKVKNLSTKSFEMVKSACRVLCWCCKLQRAFGGSEMCGSIGHWKNEGIWFLANCMNPDCVYLIDF